MQGYPVVAGYLHVQLKPLGLGGHFGEESEGRPEVAEPKHASQTIIDVFPHKFPYI